MPFQFFSNKILKTSIVVCAGLFLLSGWNGVSAQAQNSGDLNTILSQLKDRFAASKTFQADYVREIVPKIASKLPSSALQAEGQLFFLSPNKLRMDQKKPRSGAIDL